MELIVLTTKSAEFGSIDTNYISADMERTHL